MKILGYDYKIAKRLDAITLDAFGLCTWHNRILQIASDLAPSWDAEITLHEIIEALNYHLQLDLKHPVITSLEAGLNQVFAANGVDLSPLLAQIDRKKKG